MRRKREKKINEGDKIEEEKYKQQHKDTKN